MKDVFSVKRSADSDDVLKSLNGHFMQTIDVAAATTLEDVDSGKLIVVDASTGFNLTLPAAEPGLYFKILISVKGTDGNMKILTSDSGDGSQSQYFFGGVRVVSTTEDQTEVQEIPLANAAATEESYDVVVLDSDAATSGGCTGDILELHAVSTVGWCVSGTLTTTHANPGSVAGITSS